MSKAAGEAVRIEGEELARHPLMSELVGFLHIQQDCHYRQLPAWITPSDKGERQHYVITVENDRIVASSLVRRVRQTRYWAKYFVDRGPVAENTTVLCTHLRQLISETSRDGVWLRINPHGVGEGAKANEALLENMGFSATAVQTDYQATVRVDLRHSRDVVTKGYRRSLRTQINKARRELAVREANSDKDWDAFVRLYNTEAGGRSIASLDEHAVCRLKELERHGRGVLLIAEQGDAILAGIVLVHSGNAVHYVHGISSREKKYRMLPMSHLLHDSGIEWASRGGAQYYDFDGYWLERGDADPINRFKLGFSKNVLGVTRQYELVFRPRLQGVLSVAAKVAVWGWASR